MSRYRKISVCKAIWVLLIGLSLLFVFSVRAFAVTASTSSYLPIDLDENAVKSGNAVNAIAAVLIEVNSGRILYMQNYDKPLPPASTCKVITAITAIDSADLAEVAEISTNAASIGESSINLRQGEQLSLLDLLKGALVRSGNDACYAIAEQVAGNEKFFVNWLNTKANALGVYDANLLNTNGLPMDDHLISAVSLAMITRYCLANQIFSDIVSSKYVEIGEGSSYRYLQNTNKLLWQDDAVDGVKTGTTDAAGSCLIAAKQDGAAHYVSVVLHSPDRYGESLRLLNYGAENYHLSRLCSKDDIIAYIQDKQGKYWPIAAETDLWLLFGNKEYQNIKLIWHLPQIVSETQKGERIGCLIAVNGDGEQLSRLELIVGE